MWHRSVVCLVIIIHIILFLVFSMFLLRIFFLFLIEFYIVFWSFAFFLFLSCSISSTAVYIATYWISFIGFFFVAAIYNLLENSFAALHTRYFSLNQTHPHWNTQTHTHTACGLIFCVVVVAISLMYAFPY